MQTVSDPKEVRHICDAARQADITVSLVPTMGALHDGHLSLVKRAADLGEIVVVSIFVNPTQFGPGEDFEKYPRDLQVDATRLAPAGADLLFTPDVSDMYAEGASTRVVVDEITDGLCGAHRPGHFQGVATIVAKLFNIVGPCTAVFGRKDFQQLQVIRRMVRDLNMPIVIEGMPTLREPDGLAMSSRNAYLSAPDRNRALSIARGLSNAHQLFANGERNPAALKDTVLSEVKAGTDRIDYIEVRHPDTLAPFAPADNTERILIAVAAHVGTTRLIDNTVLGEDKPPIAKSS